MTNTEEKIKEVSIPSAISVQDFSARSEVPIISIISELMKNGVLANINDTIDFETAAIIGDDLGLKIIEEIDDKKGKQVVTEESVNKKDLKSRPPIVTIMGHVDHGKTTLLDNIRKASVVVSESGGITQHISAYQAKLTNSTNKKLKDKIITFIDTPGHAAFSALRGHGVAITDIAVLIVAANDGVKPQTKEVVEQAKEHNVPIIVAINKIDLPDADVMKTKQQLGDLELVPEEWGGKTVMVEISALKGDQIDNLLEMILLQAEMMELKADPNSSATGIVIDSHIHKGAGALAVVLIENGTLHKGDIIQVGNTSGKARIMEDYNSNPIDLAPPSFPVRLAGLKSLPGFGDRLVVHESEKEARLAAKLVEKEINKVHISSATKMNEEDESTEVMEIPLVVKADVRGSLEAMKKMISEIESKFVDLNIVSEGVGPVSESDVGIAKSSGAIVLSFRTRVMPVANKIADKDKTKIISGDVIYEVINNLKSFASEVLPPEIIEEPVASGKILQIFRDDKKGVVIGAKLENGGTKIGDKIKVLQDKNEKWRGQVISLRREKNEVKEVKDGQEFGIGLVAKAKVANGDEIIIFKVIEKKREVK